MEKLIVIVVVWFFIGMAIEWLVNSIAEPKSKWGKGILFFISLPFSLFIYLIGIISMIVSIPFIWLFARVFKK